MKKDGYRKRSTTKSIPESLEYLHQSIVRTISITWWAAIEEPKKYKLHNFTKRKYKSYIYSINLYKKKIYNIFYIQNIKSISIQCGNNNKY